MLSAAIRLALSLLSLSVFTVAQSSGPDTRQITDPKTLTSASSPDARPLPIDDLYFTRSVYGASWAPDGKEIVFTTDISGRLNLWKVDADGGWPIQLAQSDERQYGATWSPDGKWIVLQQDTAGNELWDLFAIPSDGGELINLTRTSEVREEAPRWSPDGKTISLNYKAKEATVYNIALMDWATRKVTPLTHESTANHSWQSVGWSPDGKTLYANRVEVSFVDADVYGPSQPTLLGTDAKPTAENERLIPVEAHGLKFLSLGQLVSPGHALAWRGPMATGALAKLIEADWGDAEMLVVDLPPGTGDVQLSLIQKSRPDGAIIVSTPQDLSLIDAARAIDLFRKMDVPVLGIIENMAGYICPHCGEGSDPFGSGGAEAAAAEIGVPFLGRLALSPALRAASDAGDPPAAGDGPEAAAFTALAQRIAQALETVGR